MSPENYTAWQGYLQFFNQKYLAGSSTAELIGSDVGRVTLMVKKNQNKTGWFLGDYDFYLTFGQANDQLVGKMENIVRLMFAQRFPREWEVRLSDKTRIIELRPNINKFSFIEDNGVKKLSSPDGKVSVFYRLDGHKLEITNNIGLWGSDKAVEGDYVGLRTGLLPQSGFWSYVKGFNFIGLKSDFLELK